MGRTRDVSKILTSNTSILSLASASSTYQTIAKTGLVEITPSTISVSGGSGSVSTTGVVSFTSASAISLNNVFSATYDRYLLILDATLSTSAETRMRFRVGGVDASGVNYDYHSNAFTNVLNNQAIASGQTSAYVNGSSGRMAFQLNVDRPFIAIDTLWNTYGNVGFTQTLASSGYHGLSNSYDSLTIFRSTGTFTGTIVTYGYNK
jgi:hypothetical protein